MQPGSSGPEVAPVTAVTRFRVTTTATGRRRTVLVCVYDDVEDMRRVATATDGQDHSRADGTCHLLGGWSWPHPDHVPLVIRLHREAMYTEVIAHESTHAAVELVFADCLRGWDARARTYLRPSFEPIAYAVGEITARIVSRGFALGLITPSRRA
jgi:hypothetical protein